MRLTLETLPVDATRWSTRDMGRRVGRKLGDGHLARLRAPAHGVETFKLSTDPQFVEKVRGIVGLYLDPPVNAVVLSIDEKTQIQALDRTQPLLPLQPGQVERRTHDYVRRRVTSLVAALNTHSGEAIGQCIPRHGAVEFRKFLDHIDAATPPELDVHVILDNASPHKTDLIMRWLAKRPRFHVHFTPTSASWINMVERLFSELTTRQLQRGAHRSVAELEAAIADYLTQRNTNPRPFIWTKTADEILENVARFCQRTSASGH